MAVTLHVRPRDEPMTWEQFCASTGPFAVALDRDTEHTIRYVTITDDEALEIVEALEKQPNRPLTVKQAEAMFAATDEARTNEAWSRQKERP